MTASHVGMVSRKGPRASSTGSGPDPSALKSRPSRESKRRASVTSPPPTPSGKRQKPQTRLALQTVRDTRQSVKSGQRDTSQTPKRRQSHGCSPIGSEAINRRLKVYWPTRKQWLDGLVTEFNKEDDKHFVKYDSGEEQWLTIKAKEDNRRLKWISNSEQNLLEENSVVATSSAAGAGSRSEAGQTSQQKSQDVALDSRETPKPSCSVNSEQWEPLETAVRISGAAGGSAYEPTSSCLHGKRVKGGSRKVDQGTEMVDTGTQSGRKSGCEKVSHRDIARVEASSRIGMQLSAANSEQKQV